MNKQEKYRIYGITLRHLSPIQKGIQFAHAIAQMSKSYGSEVLFTDRKDESEPYSHVLLQCNSTSELSEIEDQIITLSESDNVIGVPEYFREPDLGGLKTCIVFRLDMEKYNNELEESMRWINYSSPYSFISELKLAV